MRRCISITRKEEIYICVTDVDVMIMFFTALAIMILIDSTGTEAIVAMMTMVEMH